MGLDLGVGDVLGAVGVEHVEDHGNGHDHALSRGPLLLDDGRPMGGVVLNLLVGVGVFGQAHQLNVLLVGSTGALGKAVGTLGFGEGKGLGHQSEGHPEEDRCEEVEFGHGDLRYGEGNTLTM